MFNLIKFEMLKYKKLFSILGILSFLVQGFIIYKISIVKTPDLHIIGTGITLIFIININFIFSSIATFSKDINSTDRSVAFMTPYSGFTIISSKFLTSIILGMTLFSATFLWFIANLYYIDPQIKFRITEYLINGNFVDTFKILISAFLIIGNFLALVFLSIIVTKTFLSKLKFKTLIVIVVMIILSKIFSLIFWDNLSEMSSVSIGVSSISIAFIITLMLWISGWLIDNKTDF